MKNSCKMYKTLSKEDFKDIDLKISRSYFYYSDTDLNELAEKPFENENRSKDFQLIDEISEWMPQQQEVYLELTLSAKNLSILFGENGICNKDTKLAFGLIWKAEKSKIKHCLKICEFDEKSSDISVKTNTINLINMSSNVEFDIIIYIAEPSIIISNNYFGNEKGLILYNENVWNIIIDGDGSIFPIFEIQDLNGPLWSYYCDLDTIDIEEDPFDADFIRIDINKSHVAYQYINPNSPTFNKEFMKEVISNALCMILIDLRNKQLNKNFNLDLNFCEGSILQVIKYFNDNFSFRVNDNYADLLNSIKIYFDKELYK